MRREDESYFPNPNLPSAARNFTYKNRNVVVARKALGHVGWDFTKFIRMAMKGVVSNTIGTRQFLREYPRFQSIHIHFL